MQKDDILAKLKAKEEALQRETLNFDKSRKRITNLKKDIIELKEQLERKSVEKLLSVLKKENISLDDVIKTISSETSKKEDTE